MTKWLKVNETKSTAYELKITKGNTLPFSRIEEHQITSLYKAKYRILVHKISDMSAGMKPFDCFTLVKAKAYLVIMFYKPRAKKVCYAIDIDDLIDLTLIDKKKSITLDDAKKYGKEICLT